MTSLKDRFMRWLAPVGLAMCLILCPPVLQVARAQEQPPPGAPAEGGGEKGEGRPLDGYLATIVLMLLALFIVGKSARR